MNEREVYFSVDIEASGPVPGEYSMLSLGACHVAAPDRTFYSELRPISDRFVPAALDVSGFDLQDLLRRGQDPLSVMQSFGKWVVDESQGDTPVFVGFNACFDWSFVNWYFHKFVHTNPFGVGALDIKAYYMGLTGCLWGDTRSSKLPSLLKPERLPCDRHNALADAIYQGQLFQRMRQSRAELLRLTK